MLASPRRSAARQPATSWADLDDDDGWQDMPVVRSDDNPFGLDEEDRRKLHYRPPDRLDASEAGPSNSNATGQHLEVDADTQVGDDWRKRSELDEGDYTRLRLNEDEESEEVHMRTRYLFDDAKAMTPLSQMQATKELLTEGQRIAYVGLCQLIATRMLRDIGRGWSGKKLKGLAKIKGKGKEEIPVVESGNIWMIKIMARLYQHMEVEREEQRMIESLAEHGVDPADLVPALMATHTVNNPDFDPVAKKKSEMEGEDKEQGFDNTDAASILTAPPPPYESPSLPDLPSISKLDLSSSTHDVASPPRRERKPSPIRTRSASVNPFGSDDEEEDTLPPPTPRASSSRLSPALTTARPSIGRLPSYELDDEDGGDIGRIASPVRAAPQQSANAVDGPETPTRASLPLAADEKDAVKDPEASEEDKAESTHEEDEENVMAAPLPSLPGVSTSLSTTDEKVTLDIRWTVLCDLFLVLIGDSVYDARSRTFLENVATALGFEWLDVVRFENRVTEALEIEEAVERTEQGEIIQGRKVMARNKRYAMMGMAAVGGGLIIGLSAGLMAPFIGAGLGAALATVGVSGTTGFLAGAGGAAVITTGGVLTGANIAGKGMARRTREVRTFEFKPLHNNKRVSCYIAVPGFMASKVDDVRLPFSTLDPIVGDVVSILWEPDMMAEMGGALKILTSEVLTQVGQQVLQATLMTALLSALQWPLILTKLGYLIDNPWSNALDRARAAGLVLADTIMQRHAGVRPISLIGFSLGARAIFYALIELARCKAYGLVQDVFIFGTTVTASASTWLDVRSAVSGRFVNAYASNDWMLGYLFRATSGGINTVAGLRPVESVPGLENVDVTDIITGHMSYRSLMPQLLKTVGFPVTADYFDEPEDPELDMSVQERTIVNEADEEAKRNRKKILGLFPVNNNNNNKGKTTSTSQAGSGTATPHHDANARRSGSLDKSNSYDYDEGDADDLPPREAEADIGESSHRLDHSESRDSIATSMEEDPEVKAIPKTAGFDFQAISRALGKDIDVERLKVSEPSRIDASLRRDMSLQPPERTGSAPPPSSTISDTSFGIGGNTATSSFDSRPANARSTTMFASEGGGDNNTDDHGDDDDDAGDIAGPSRSGKGGPALDIPSWERPQLALASSSTSDLPRVSPSISSSDTDLNLGAGSSFKTPPFNFNAWSSSSSTTTADPSQSNSTSPGTNSFPMSNRSVSASQAAMPIRSAPPARPHPPELMANPFASAGFAEDDDEVARNTPKSTNSKGSGLGAGVGLPGWGKKPEDKWADANPW